MTTTTAPSRTDLLLDTLAAVAPVAGLIFLVRYTSTRANAARDGDSGASTVEMIIWSGIGLVVALSVGAVLFTALRNRATTVGNDLQNQSIPTG